MKKMFENKILKNIIIGFIALNIGIFTVACASQSIGRPNARAKVFMSAATTMNVVYIFPLYKIFGWDNIVAKPFVLVRNGLYNVGLKLLPKNDGEREMWWFAVKYKEYDDFVNPNIYLYIKKYKKYTPEHIKTFYNWTDEVYNHIEPFATMKIADKKLREKRFGLFVDVVWEYINGRYLFVSLLGAQNGDRKLFRKSPKELQRFEEVLKIYSNSKNYTQKYEPEGWNHFYNETLRYHYDNVIQDDIAIKLLKAKLDKCQLSCNDPYIKIYGEARTNLKKYMYDRRLPVADRDMLNWLIDWNDQDVQDLVNTCPNNPYLQDLKSDIEYFKKIHQGKNPKNEFFDDLKSGNY